MAETKKKKKRVLNTFLCYIQCLNTLFSLLIARNKEHSANMDVQEAQSLKQMIMAASQ